MGLPFDYAARNLARRRLRTVLTGASTALVAALFVAVAAFVRGLEATFSGAAREDTALLLSSAAERDVVRSTVDPGLAQFVTADVPGVLAASSEIHMGTTVRLADGQEGPGFVRGVTTDAYAVHDALTVTEGRLPSVGEVLVGRLVARQLGVEEAALAVGSTVHIEGSTFTVAGRFVAPGTTLEAEIWTPLEPLRGLTQRDDSSVVFVRVEDPRVLPRLELFTKRRLDLELAMIPSAEYYRELADYFRPIQGLALGLAVLVGLAGLFGGANTMAATVADRVRELAALRAVGFTAGALSWSIALESLLLCAGGGVLGLALARLALAGGAVRLAMSAFELRIDAFAVLVGFGGALALGVAGALPAAWRVLRLPIAAALKED
jgi:putative ABC transport system permease protein